MQKATWEKDEWPEIELEIALGALAGESLMTAAARVRTHACHASVIEWVKAGRLTSYRHREGKGWGYEAMPEEALKVIARLHGA